MLLRHNLYLPSLFPLNYVPFDPVVQEHRWLKVASCEQEQR